jgi:hypothetical protein
MDTMFISLNRRPSLARLEPVLRCEFRVFPRRVVTDGFFGGGSGGNSFRALQKMGLGEDYAKVAGRSLVKR